MTLKQLAQRILSLPDTDQEKPAMVTDGNDGNGNASYWSVQDILSSTDASINGYEPALGPQSIIVVEDMGGEFD